MTHMRTWAASMAAAFALVPGAASAQQPAGAPTDEIVVTAQKRAQNLQDVPIAVTALSGEALSNAHVTDVLDLNALAPGLQIKTDDNAANPKIFIRGVGLNDFNPNTASAVALYTDGVYIGSPLAQMSQFFDLDRVEVLRGPQGTLYGRNTTGGAINLISRKPTPEWTGDASIEAGSFGSTTVEGAIGGPIADNLVFRAAGIYVRDDGYTKNRLTGRDGNNTDRGSARLSFAWTPSTSFDALVQFRYGRSRGGSILAYNRPLFPGTATVTGPDGFCAPTAYTSGACTDIAGYANTSTDLYKGDYHLEGKDSVETFGASATLTWNLGKASLVSVSGYDHADRDDVEDTDAGPNDVLTARYRAKQWAASEELRLQSNGGGATNWVAGLYYARDDLKSNSYLDVLRIFNSGDPATDLANGLGVFAWPFTQETNSYAAFGQVDYSVSPKLTATVGLRYSADDKKFNYDALYGSVPDDPGAFSLFAAPFDRSKTFSSLSGKLGAQYAFSKDLNVYASFNRGYKSGGFFGGQTVDPATLGPYNDELVNAYEIGLKSQLFDRRLRANFSTFYYDYQDLQVYTLILQGVTTVQNFTNASNARIYGGEAELSASPVKGLDVSLSASLLEATYQDFKSAGADYSGNTLPNAPKASVTAAATYEWALAGGVASAGVDASYLSNFFYDTRNLALLSDPSRTFVNARLAWQTSEKRLELGVFGRNVFDETNISDIIPIEGLGFDLFSMGPPRSAGVFARFHY